VRNNEFYRQALGLQTSLEGQTNGNGPRHLPGLLNYLKHRITNAASEGIDSQVARIVATARGLSGFARLRTLVLFFLGKLHLSPT